MSNQSLNSLALVSARYTHTALDVLFQLASYYLFALCQALDLRAMQDAFFRALRPAFEALTAEILGSATEAHGPGEKDHLKRVLWPRLQKELSARTTLDAAHRIRDSVSALQPLLLQHHGSNSAPDLLPQSLERWTHDATALATRIYMSTRAAYIAHPDATPLLAPASARMYTYIRRELGVPFIHGDGEYARPTRAGGAAVITRGGESVLDEIDGEEVVGGGGLGEGDGFEAGKATLGGYVLFFSLPSKQLFYSFSLFFGGV